VLLLDMDTLMTSAMDELYELDHDLIHTRNGKGTEALQGGFLLVRLSLCTVFYALPPTAHSIPPIHLAGTHSLTRLVPEILVSGAAELSALLRRAGGDAPR
jgi:hypothetical protein